MTIPPNREPGDTGHVDDHDAISGVLTDHQTRLGEVEALVDTVVAGAVASVNGQTGVVVLAAADLDAVDIDQLGVASGVATLDGDGKVPEAQLPESLGGGAVDSVNGATGVVVLDASDVGALADTGGTVTGAVTLDGAQLAVERAAATDTAWAAQVGSDAVSRVSVDVSGRIELGDGTGAGDTALYRSGAAELTTDDAFIAGSWVRTPSVRGSSASAGELSLASTSHATKGKIRLGTSAYDEASNRLGVGKDNPAVPLDVVGAGAFTGALTVGGNLSVTGVGQRRTVVKPSDQSRSSVTALASDSALTATVAADARYEVEFHLIVTGPSAGGFKTAWAVPSGTTAVRTVLGPKEGAQDAEGMLVRNSAHDVADPVSYGQDAVDSPVGVVERAVVDTTASGSITLQWAQSASDGGDTTVLARSHMKIVRVA